MAIMSDLSGLSTFYKNTTNVTVIIDSVANYFDNVMRVIAVIIHLVYRLPIILIM